MQIYLNKNWDSNFRGNLEFWTKGITSKIDSISPQFNLYVIFNTDAESHHGHPDHVITPIEITRKSLALYYYSASKKEYEDTPANSTMYFVQPNDNYLIKKQAAKLRRQNYINDWILSIVIRSLIKFKKLRNK